MTLSQRKELNTSDDAFFKSVKDTLNQKKIKLLNELEFWMMNNELIEARILETALENKDIFFLSNVDVELLCGIAHEKCQTVNPSADDALETWIDALKLSNLIY